MKKILIIFILASFGQKGICQMNDPLYDRNQKVHFGFSVIGTYGKMKFSRSQDFFTIQNEAQLLDTLKWIETTNFPGLGVGGIINFHLNEFWDLRTILIVQVMAQRNLTYHFSSGAKRTAVLQSTYLEVPLLLNIKVKDTKTQDFM